MSSTLFVGHSLVGQVMPNMFNSFMESMSFDVHADAQVINGASLRYNWDNGASAEGVNAREVLPSGEYDTVIVTEAIPLDDQIRWNDTQGYVDRYFDLAQATDADTRIFLYETWHYIGADTNAWRAQIDEDLHKWQGIVDYVNDNADADAAEAFIIPAGQAMGALHDRIEAGDVPGVSSIRELFSDDIHLNDTGSWFIAALHASAVTGVDVAALPLETFNVWGVPYGGPDAALAEVMAEVIDETLAEFLPDDVAPPTDDTEIPDPVDEGETAEDDTPDGNGESFALYGGAGNDQLYRGVGDDALYGFGGNDSLYGGDGNDSLIGGTGNDLIIGDAGDDVLTVGEGADTVSGGEGDDVFVLTGEPGSVLITDFGADGARDMIDLSAIGGYDRLSDLAEIASFPGSDTVLTFAVPNGELTVTVQSDEPLTSADFGLPADPDGPSELTAPVEGAEPADPANLTYTIEGADQHHFVVDAETGEIGNRSWFDPSYDQVWDVSGDRIYEVERVGSNEDGQEVSRAFFEMETTVDGVVWREVGGEVADAEPIDDSRTFFLEGADAYHFVIDPENGEIDNATWFEPSYDQVWDTNGDRIYEAERYALAEDGTEVSREALEMETTPDGVVWRVVSSTEDDELSAAQIMSALALPPADETDVPVEPEDTGEEVALTL